MAGNEVGLVDVVRALDGLIAEAQVADGQAAALFGIIGEVALGIEIGVVADDLDGVFIGAHSAIGAEAPELAADGRLRRGIGGFGLQQREVGDIIGDANGEAGLFAGFEFVVNSEHGSGGGDPCCPGRSGR